MDKNKLISEMYGLMLMLEQEWKDTEIVEDFPARSKKKVLELYNNSLNWMVEDERNDKDDYNSDE